MLLEPASWNTRFPRLNIHYLSIYTNKPVYPTCPLLRFEQGLRSTTCFKFMTQQQLLMTKKNSEEDAEEEDVSEEEAVGIVASQRQESSCKSCSHEGEEYGIGWRWSGYHWGEDEKEEEEKEPVKEAPGKDKKEMSKEEAAPEAKKQKAEATESLHLSVSLLETWTSTNLLLIWKLVSVSFLLKMILLCGCQNWCV